MATIDLDFTDEELLVHAKWAHESGLSLNEFYVRAIYSYLVNRQQEEIEELRWRMKTVRKLLKKITKRLRSGEEYVSVFLDEDLLQDEDRPQGE